MSTTFTKNISFNSSSGYNAFNPQFGGAASSTFVWRGWGGAKYNNQYGFAGVNASACRAAFVYRFTTPDWAGDVTSLTLSVKLDEELGRNRTIRASVTTTDPTANTTAYTAQTLPTDSGRIHSEDIIVAASTETDYTISISSTAILKNKTYYLVLSPYTTASGSSNYITIHTMSLSGYVTYEADATVVTAENGNIGSALTIAMTDDGMSHTLTYSFGSTTGSIGTTTLSTFNWTPPNSLMSEIPAATSGTCTITCTTDAGTTTCTITLYVPSSIKPTISTATYNKVQTSATVTSWNIWLQGYTAIHCVLNATANYSTIKSWRVDCGAVVFTGDDLSTASIAIDRTSDVLTVPGTYSIVYSVTDARGRTVSTTPVSFTVVAYAAPTVENAEVYRCTSDGTRDDRNGTYLRAYAKVVYSQVGNNAIQAFNFQYKERTQAESAYVSTALTDQTALIVGAGGINVLKAYNARIYIQDSLSGSYINFVISSQTVAFNLKPSADSGAAFGGYAQDDKYLELLNGWKLRAPSSQHIVVYVDGQEVTLQDLIDAGGGSGGTTNYNVLSNKPTINSVTLAGNKTSADLGLESTSNKKATISSSSTDDEYPTAKCVYGLIGNVESILEELL